MNIGKKIKILALSVISIFGARYAHASANNLAVINGDISELRGKLREVLVVKKIYSEEYATYYVSGLSEENVKALLGALDNDTIELSSSQMIVR